MTAAQLVAGRASAGSGTLMVRTDVDCSLTVNGTGFGMLQPRDQRTAITLSVGPNTVACTTDDGTRLAVIAFGPMPRQVIGGTPADQSIAELDINLRPIIERWRGVLPRLDECVLARSTSGKPPVVYDDAARPAEAIISCVNAGFHKADFGLEAESRFHLARPIHVLRQCADCPDLTAIEIEADSPIDPAPGAVFVTAPPPCVLTDQTRGYLEAAHLRCPRSSDVH